MTGRRPPLGPACAPGADAVKAYIIRRLLLMIADPARHHLVCFLLIQFVPGGPVEEMISKVQQAASAEGRAAPHLPAGDRRTSRPISASTSPRTSATSSGWARWRRLDLGKSYAYQEPVWDVIQSKFPISLFFGLTSFVLSYLVCIPLGVAKALRNGSLVRYPHFRCSSSAAT